MTTQALEAEGRVRSLEDEFKAKESYLNQREEQLNIAFATMRAEMDAEKSDVTEALVRQKKEMAQIEEKKALLLEKERALEERLAAHELSLIAELQAKMEVEVNARIKQIEKDFTLKMELKDMELKKRDEHIHHMQAELKALSTPQTKLQAKEAEVELAERERHLNVLEAPVADKDNVDMEDLYESEEDDDDYENHDLAWTPGAKMISKHIDFDEIQFCGTLGHGAFSSVKLVRVPAATQAAERTRTGMVVEQHEYFAIKVMARSHIVDNGWEDLVDSERAAMAEIVNFGLDGLMAKGRKRFTIGLHHAFFDDLCVYLLVDFCPGGELYDFCQSQEHACVTPTQSRFFAACIVLALQEVHGCDMIYRDLKLENLILDAKGYLIMADFGIAKKTTRTYTVCGTPEYMAPEVILSRGHNRAVDLWSLGITIFEIICGTTPFLGGDSMETYENIVQYVDDPRSNRASLRGKRASGERDNLPWHICDSVIDGDTRDIVGGLLKKSSFLRLGARSKSLHDLVQHPFFNSMNWAALAAKELEESVIPHCPLAMDPSGFDGNAVPLKHHVVKTVGEEDGLYIDRSGWIPNGFQRV